MAPDLGGDPELSARPIAQRRIRRRHTTWARRRAHQATVAGPAGRPGRPSFRRAWANGARLTLDEAVAYVRRSRGARRRPATGWASLTPTEFDVVRLMVDGLSNPEIGSRLFVSRGTVKTHLSHVDAKLGVANRTELATLATPRLAKADDPEKGARSDRTDLLRGGWSDEARGVGRDALHGGPPC